MSKEKVSKIEAIWNNMAMEIAGVLVHDTHWQTNIAALLEKGISSEDFPEMIRPIVTAMLKRFEQGQQYPNIHTLNGDAQKAAELKSIVHVDDIHPNKFKETLDEFKKRAQSITVLESMNESIKFLYRGDFDQAMSAINDGMDRAAMRSNNTISDSGDDLWTIVEDYRTGNAGAPIPTGLPVIDDRLGLRVGGILAGIGYAKSGKTRLTLNAIINVVRFFIQEKEYTNKALTFLRSDGNRQASLATVLDATGMTKIKDAWRYVNEARKWIGHDGPYPGRGIGFAGLEKARFETALEITGMMMIDWIIEGKQLHEWYLQKLRTTEGQERDAVVARYGLLPEPHPQWGYYLTPDRDENNAEVASYVSLPKILEAGDMSRWGIRRLAYEMARREWKERWGTTLRIWDDTPEGGNVGSYDGLSARIAADRRRYRDQNRLTLLALDYVQNLDYKNYDERQRLEAFARLFPKLVTRNNLAMIMLFQRSKSSSETSGLASVSTGARGSGANDALFENSFVATGPWNFDDVDPLTNKPTNDRGKIHLAWRGGRYSAQAPQTVGLYVNGASGRVLPEHFSRFGKVVTQTYGFEESEAPPPDL